MNIKQSVRLLVSGPVSCLSSASMCSSYSTSNAPQIPLCSPNATKKQTLGHIAAAKISASWAGSACPLVESFDVNSPPSSYHFHKSGRSTVE